MGKIRCKTCVGSGKIMGGGMMLHDCDDCDGRGKIEEIIKDIKSTSAYNHAIEKIKSLDPKLTDADAAKLFDEASQKLDRKDVKDASTKAVK